MSVIVEAAERPLRKPRPPGPKLTELAAWWLRPGRRMYQFLPAVANRWGDVVDIPVPWPGVTATLVSHPEHVNHIMTSHYGNYAKSAAARELVMGEPLALPLLEGEEWKRTRRAFNPHFAEKALAAVSEEMATAVTEEVERLPVAIDSGPWTDLEHALGAVVMSGLLRSMFSMSVEHRMLDEWVSAVHDYGKHVIVRAAMSSVPDWVPRPGTRSGHAAKALLMSRLDMMIENRVRDPRDGKPDLLDVALAMEFPGTPAEQYARMRSELAGLVFAGFETTAEALSWTFAMLCRNPQALARAYAEVDQLQRKPIEYAHLQQLPYLRACFDEAQREQAAPVNVRTAREDDEIGGYFIPAGSHVLISPYGLHHDQRFWNEPDTYQPNRFLTDTIDKNAFIPFNTGPRKCMGSRMAYIEGVMTLAVMLQRYTFEIRDGWYPRHAMRVSTGLVSGLPVRIHPR